MHTWPKEYKKLTVSKQHKHVLNEAPDKIEILLRARLNEEIWNDAQAIGEILKWNP